MSRIGAQSVPLPAGVTVKVDGTIATVKGPKGELRQPLPYGITATTEGNSLKVMRSDDSREVRARHGLARNLLRNLVVGVSQGYSKVLEIEGVGYRAAMEGRKLTLQLGFTHPVTVTVPPLMDVVVDKQKQNVITLSSPDKALLGQFSAQLREWKPPEPYKGKGMRYQGERIRRKAGKAGKAGAKA